MIALLALLALALAARGEVIAVPGDAASIGEALNSAEARDVIEVAPGE